MGPVILSTQFTSSSVGFQQLGGVGSDVRQRQRPDAVAGQQSGSPLATTALSVQNAVDALLESIEPALGSDQQLRMIIAMLILNALLGQNDDERSGRAAELAGLSSGLQSQPQRSQFAYFSATNVIQIHHQSTLVYTDQAIQSLGDEAGGGSMTESPQLDITG